MDPRHRRARSRQVRQRHGAVHVEGVDEGGEACFAEPGDPHVQFQNETVQFGTITEHAKKKLSHVCTSRRKEQFILQEYGSILLGVSYLPTAQRLTINVMRARDVRFTPALTSLADFSEYST